MEALKKENLNQE